MSSDVQTQAAASPDCATLAPPKVYSKGESRTQLVIGLTAFMMVAELIAGAITNSLALTADGWHMGTHVAALGLTALAYWYARTRAGEARFAFGTGKVYSLSGYTSAGLLVAIAIGMAIDAVARLVSPEEVHFTDALPVAVIGLVVNVVSAVLLHAGTKHDHSGHDHSHHDHDHAGHDHNLRAAYLHVVADAVTSLLAIGSLLAGRWLNWVWLDAGVALVGSAVILKWGVGLLRECAQQLIDYGPSGTLRSRILAALNGVEPGTRVEDLHLWRAGHNTLVCVATVTTPKPQSLGAYKEAVLKVAPVDHLTVELRALSA